MGITPGFKESDVRKRFDGFLEAIEAEAITMLKKLGEEAVIHARSLPAEVGFHDQTGNLRSSIGYMIFKDGVPLVEKYQQVTGGAEGVQKGMALAMKVGESKKGFCLVVTAGMNYALYVESKGRDVLASAESMTRQRFAQQVEQLKNNIKKAMNE